MWQRSKQHEMLQGRAGNALGKRNESRALEDLCAAHRSGGLPSWVTEVRAGTDEEDEAGSDLVVETDRGPVGVQIKSGRQSYLDFMRQERSAWIACVIVKKEIPGKVLVREIVSQVEVLYSVL